MRILFSFLLLLSMLLRMAGCQGMDTVTVLDDPADYSLVPTLGEYRSTDLDGRSYLFPESLDEKQVSSFRCEHTTLFLFGTAWEMLLIVEYTGEAYENEVARLGALCRESYICGDNEYFDLPAYASVFNFLSSFEYALLLPDGKSVAYVYLQLMEPQNISLAPAYVPKGYSLDMPTPQFTIYSESYQ